MAFSPDGRLLATGDAYSRALLWDPVTGQLVAALEGHTKSVADVVFSPGGDHLATASGATEVADHLAHLRATYELIDRQLRADPDP